MRRPLLSLAGAAVLAAGVAGTVSPLIASAANSSSVASISIAAVSGPSGAAATQPALGSSIWYAESYSSTTKNPVIETDCYQNGTIVWGEVVTVSSANTNGVKLGGDSSPWLQSGGAASCVAMLQSRTFKPSGETVTTLAKMAFSAAS